MYPKYYCGHLFRILEFWVYFKNALCIFAIQWNSLGWKTVSQPLHRLGIMANFHFGIFWKFENFIIPDIECTEVISKYAAIMTDYQQCVVRNGEQSGVIAKTPFFYCPKFCTYWLTVIFFQMSRMSYWSWAQLINYLNPSVIGFCENLENFNHEPILYIEVPIIWKNRVQVWIITHQWHPSAAVNHAAGTNQRKQIT